MNVLVFTSLFPNNVWPNHGIFIQQRVAHVNELPGCEMQVVAPVPYYPPLGVGWRRAFRDIVSEQVMDGLHVDFPRYLMIPKIAMSLQGVLMFLSVLPSVSRIRRTFPFELIDAHYVYPDGFAAVLLGWWFRVPVVVSARGSDVNVFATLPLIRRLVAWTLGRADAVITVSQALQERVLEQGVAAEHVSVIPNGVDRQKFPALARETARDHLALPGVETQIVLVVCNLNPNKGVDLVLRAWMQVQAASTTGRPLLMIVGGGAYRRTLEELVDALGIRDSVRFVGPVAHDDLFWYYNAANLICLMSEREGWPNVVVEALSCGRPVVASRAGGIPEILTSSEVGVLVDRNVEAVASGLQAALQRTWCVETIVEHASAFQWQHAAQAVESVFRRVRKHQSGVLQGV